MSEINTVFSYNGRSYDIAGLDKDEYIFKNIETSKDFYESDLLRVLSYLPFQEGLFVDAGANIGNHSLFFAGELNRDVVAIEMDDQNFEVLKRNIERNGLAGRIRYLQAALGDREGRAYFRRHPGNSGGSTQVAGSQEYDGQAIQIPLDTLKFPSRVACIKIDVEGQEEAVIGGGIATISRDKPILIIETRNGPGFHRVWRQLMSYEYHPIMVAAKTETYVFCHRAVVARCNDIMSIYYSRQFQIMAGIPHFQEAGGRPNDTLALSKELSRIKRLIGDFAQTNYNIRQELRATRRNFEVMLRQKELWEKAASQMSAKINRAHDNNERIAPVRIRLVREKINAEIAQDGMKASQTASNVNSYLVTDLRERDSDTLNLYILTSDLKAALVEDVTAGFRTSLRRMQVTYLSLPSASGEFALDALPEQSLVQVARVRDRVEALHLIANAGVDRCIAVIDHKGPIDMRAQALWVAKACDSLTDGDIVVRHGLLLAESEAGQASSPSPNQKPHAAVAASADLTLVAPEGLGHLADFLDFEATEAKPAEAVMAMAARRAGLRMVHVNANRVDALPSAESYQPIVEALQNAGFADQGAAPASVDLAIIGRLNGERWQRGGIYHSNRSYEAICQKAGISHLALEIDQDVRAIARAAIDARQIFIYTGDQIAQDYYNVEPLVRHFDARGRSVIVNLSYDSHPDRTDEIVQLLSQTSDRVRMMVFSESVANDPAIVPFRDRLTVIPKTIRTVNRRELGFTESRGVFMGDLSKFLNPRITREAERTYRALRAALPDEPIYFVTQYRNSIGIPEWLDNYELQKYDPNLLMHLCGARIYLHTQNFCTFEMLPVEAMLSGVPVIHVDMPQSLNDYIGAAGIRYSSVEQMTEGLRNVYFKEKLWLLLSQMGQGRAHNFTEEATSALFERALLSSNGGMRV